MYHVGQTPQPVLLPCQILWTLQILAEFSWLVRQMPEKSETKPSNIFKLPGSWHKRCQLMCLFIVESQFLVVTCSFYFCKIKYIWYQFSEIFSIKCFKPSLQHHIMIMQHNILQACEACKTKQNC